MAKTKIYQKRSTGDVEFNMTPMIDCTFLLIIFFILSATVLNDALAQLELHQPYKSQARDEKALNDIPNRIIVNVVSDAKDKFDKNSLESSTIKEYMINGEIIKVRETDKLVRRIKQGATNAKKANHRNFFVEIRADHRVNFGAVQAVLKAAAGGGIPGINMKMNITALTSR